MGTSGDLAHFAHHSLNSAGGPDFSCKTNANALDLPTDPNAIPDQHADHVINHSNGHSMCCTVTNQPFWASPARDIRESELGYTLHPIQDNTEKMGRTRQKKLKPVQKKWAKRG